MCTYTIQLILNPIKHTCTMYLTQDAFHFTGIYSMHECACKIDDVEALMQITHVCTRCVLDSLHEHVCMSVTYKPNLVSMYNYVDVHGTAQFKLH